MHRITAILIAAVFALPLHAQDETGRDLMGEALRLFMKGLMDEMEPAVNGLEGFLQDLNGYHAPEVLPNGDIIIRRKTPEEQGEIDGGEVDL